ncbi:cytochrome P450 [Daedaleopsis nitida]|nr:cytochrome P450 [Daedaleopsis nitida]
MVTHWFILSIAGALVLVVYKCRPARQHHLPPGPRPLPIVGNVLDFPRNHLGREFRDISLTYGEVAYMKVLGQSIVLLGSYEAACDLFEKRSANYSDRPHSVMVNLTNLDWMFVFKNYGLEWRRYRRAFHTQFLPSMLSQYEPILLQVGHNLVQDLLKTPDDFSRHIKFSFAASILRIVYGVDLTQGDTKHYKLAQNLASIAEDISTPGRHVVEAFPGMLQLPPWFPGTGFRKMASLWKNQLVTIRDQLFDSARDEMNVRGVKESIITRLTEAGEDEEVARNVTATIYAAGADTTNSSVHAFILAMALNPDAQRKAQAELDSVVGGDRLPQFSDQESLPYVTALVKEVLRWHIVAPIGVPHRSLEDDVYNGLLIPGGSIVMVNQWALSRDESMYPDPERFYPERFLKNGHIDPDVRDPITYAFGFGRRVCPGKHFAEASLFIMCALILHTLDIKPPIDEKGVPKKLDVYMGSALAVSHPDPFQCQIIPRDSRRAQLARAAVSA